MIAASGCSPSTGKGVLSSLIEGAVFEGVGRKVTVSLDRSMGSGFRDRLRVEGYMCTNPGAV